MRNCRYQFLTFCCALLFASMGCKKPNSADALRIAAIAIFLFVVASWPCFVRNQPISKHSITTLILSMSVMVLESRSVW